MDVDDTFIGLTLAKNFSCRALEKCTDFSPESESPEKHEECCKRQRLFEECATLRGKMSEKSENKLKQNLVRSVTVLNLENVLQGGDDVVVNSDPEKSERRNFIFSLSHINEIVPARNT